MSTEVRIPFRALLKEYRLAAGLTQEALAERAGVSTRNVQALERGENRPLKDTARRLAAALALDEWDHARLLAAVMPLPRRRTAAITPPAGAPQAIAPPQIGAELPTGMPAVLVAAARGYTAVTHLHGAAAGATPATRFAALAGEAVATEGGRVMEVRGGEVRAVFTSARAALRAATGLLARCAEEASGALPLRAGIGLDVGGSVSALDSDRGEATAAAAQLCAQAGPGELLATEAAVQLARQVEGIVYLPRGAVALKGFARPVGIWLVRADPGGTGPEASAAGTVQAATVAPAATPCHNLPEEYSTFIGRERERAKVAALLASRRLVTLVGAGGVGKTQLALAVARGLVDQYPHGVWLVELAALPATSSSAALAPGILAALGLQEEAGRPLLATLSTHLATRRLLLVLDNCEHLIAACAELAAAVLRAAPAVRILATSREGLGVAGERRYRVPPLAVPDPRRLPRPELVGRFEAVQLFLERAQERREDFALTERNAQAIAEICARLDGLPLAIELAAARAGSMPVEGIAARLDDRF